MCGNASYCEGLELLEPDIEQLQTMEPKWHSRTCYASFCSKTNLTRLQKRSEKESADNPDTESDLGNTSKGVYISRCAVPAVQWEKCIFCQKRHKNQSLHQILTKNGERTIQSIATRDEKLRCRVAELDLIAYEARYHSHCLLKWSRQYRDDIGPSESFGTIFNHAFEKIVVELNIRFADGHIYTLHGIHNRYCQILTELGTAEVFYLRQRLKDKLSNHYGETIKFVQPLDKTQSFLIFPKVPIETAVQALNRTTNHLHEETIKNDLLHNDIYDEDELFMKAISHVANKIKSDLNNTKGHDGYMPLMKNMQWL